MYNVRNHTPGLRACSVASCIIVPLPLQMAKESHKSCPSTQSTWLRMTKGIFLHLHLSLSAPTRGTAACLDKKDLSWLTWQSVTSLSQLYFRVSYATHLTLQSWWRNEQNQGNQMDFFFCWTPTLFKEMSLKRQLGAPGLINLSKSTSTHLRNILHLDLDLMGWAPWRKWPEQKALSNFLTIRRNALFTTERNARLRSTWIKFRGNAIVLPGLFTLTRAKTRWKLSS